MISCIFLTIAALVTVDLTKFIAGTGARFIESANAGVGSDVAIIGEFVPGYYFLKRDSGDILNIREKSLKA